MKQPKANPAEEGKISQITIRPDGRVYVFGICREVLDLLDELGGGRDEKLRRLLDELRQAEPPA